MLMEVGLKNAEYVWTSYSRILLAFSPTLDGPIRFLFGHRDLDLCLESEI